MQFFNYYVRMNGKIDLISVFPDSKYEKALQAAKAAAVSQYGVEQFDINDPLVEQYLDRYDINKELMMKYLQKKRNYY